MQINYNREEDCFTLVLNRQAVFDRDVIASGVSAYFAVDGVLVKLEVRHASLHIDAPEMLRSIANHCGVMSAVD